MGGSVTASTTRSNPLNRFPLTKKKGNLSEQTAPEEGRLLAREKQLAAVIASAYRQIPKRAVYDAIESRDYQAYAQQVISALELWVGDIQEFKTAYDITLTGDMKYINLMHDIWLWDDKTGKIGAEILFSVKPNEHILYWGNPKNYFGQKPGARSVQFTQNGVNYNMLIK